MKPEEAHKKKKLEAIRWIMLLFMWGVSSVPFFFLYQKKHFGALVAGLLLFVCAFVVGFWFTCRNEKQDSPEFGPGSDGVIDRKSTGSFH